MYTYDNNTHLTFVYDDLGKEKPFHDATVNTQTH